MNLTDLLSDVSFLSSIAIILGTVFVVFQLRQNSRLIFAARDHICQRFFLLTKAAMPIAVAATAVAEIT